MKDKNAVMRARKWIQKRFHDMTLSTGYLVDVRISPTAASMMRLEKRGRQT